MTLPMFITAAQVAGLLELPRSDSFLNQRAALEERGFPLPCPWTFRPMKWRRELVEAWISQQGHPRAFGEGPRLVGGNAALMARAATP